MGRSMSMKQNAIRARVGTALLLRGCHRLDGDELDLSVQVCVSLGLLASPLCAIWMSGCMFSSFLCID